MAAKTWYAPVSRPALIEDLVSGVGQYSTAYISIISSHPPDRYNPSNVGILEDYLFHQIRSQEYDSLANLAILKLYSDS